MPVLPGSLGRQSWRSPDAQERMDTVRACCCRGRGTTEPAVSRVPAFLGLLASVVVVGFALQSATASSTRSVHEVSVQLGAQLSDGDRVAGEGVDGGRGVDVRRILGSAHEGAPAGTAPHLLGACAAILAAVLVLAFAARVFCTSAVERGRLRSDAWARLHRASARGAPDHQELCVRLC